MTGGLSGHSDPIRNALQRRRHFIIVVAFVFLLKEGRVKLIPVTRGKELILLLLQKRILATDGIILSDATFLVY